MKTEAISAVILCGCSGIIEDKIDWEKVRTALASHPARPRFRVETLACGCENLAELAGWLRELGPARVVVAACSPREHERTFRSLLQEGGVNPFLLQMVNLREQGVWVTAEPAEATAKAVRLIGAALNRVLRQEPLEERRVPVRTEVAILGAGPAGMQAALTLARAGRKVTLIEREPFLGGLPVRYEELFPNLECGPCLLEPVQGELLHGPESELVRILTLAEVGEVKGSFGNWILSVKQTPRYLDEEQCIGCMLCAEVCPARRPHRWNPSGESPAVAPPFAGALPNLPFVAAEACLRLAGGECEECLNACPVPGTLDFKQGSRGLTVEAGAIIVATGAVEKQLLPRPFDELPDVYSAYGFERLLAVSGPTGGELVCSDGSAPRSLAIVQCAGSFEAAGETDYCSGTCCRAALKYAHLAAAKLPDLTVTRLVREQSLPGIGAARQLRHQSSDCLRYRSFAGIEPVRREEGGVLLVEGR